MLRQVAQWMVAVSCAAGCFVGVTRGENLASGGTAAAARQAVSQYRPVTKAELDVAWSELYSAVTRLDEALQAAGETGKTWRTWIALDQLRTEISGPQAPDMEVLQRLYANYSSGHYGLNMVWFADVREALGSYMNIARALNDVAGNRQQYQRFLTALVPHLEALESAPSQDHVQFVNATLRWLHSYGQGSELAALVRQRYQQPNFLVNVSEKLVDAVVGGTVHEDTPVRDCILGTQIYGSGTTTGTLHAQLTPDPSRVALDTIFQGIAHTNNVGYNGPAIICTVSQTSLCATKRLWIDENGIVAAAAQANASTSTTITGIGSQNGRKLVERVASRRAAQSKPEAEAIAASHARQRIAERIEAQSAETLARFNGRFEQKIRRPLAERGVYPAALHYSSTDDDLLVSALETRPYQLGAVQPQPPLPPGVDLTLRIHESAFNNFAETVFNGMLLHEEELHDTLMDLVGVVPDELKPDDARTPWAVRFEEQKPITLSVGKGEFQVVLRGAGFQKGDRWFPAMEVAAKYRVENGKATAKAVRVGPVEVAPPDFVAGRRSKLSGPEVAIRKNLSERFNKIFKEQVFTDIVPKGELEKIGKLIPVYASAESGWLTIGYRLESHGDLGRPINQTAEN